MAGKNESRQAKGSSSEADRPVPREIESDRAVFLDRLGTVAPSFAPTSEQLSLLDHYTRLLYEQTTSLALVSKNDRPVLYTRHVLDSLGLLSLFPSAPQCALDIGSGGGLPGIPVAIAWPSTRVVLLEARDKKAGFLERAVRALGLKNVRVACERLEEHARKGEPIYDTLFIRAVAEPYRLIDEIAPRCVAGAAWVYFAGGGVDVPHIQEELARAGRTAALTTGVGSRLLHGLV